MVVKFEQWLNQTRQDVRRMQTFPSPLTQFPYHLASPTAFSYEKASLSGTEDKGHPAMQVKSQLFWNFYRIICYYFVLFLLTYFFN